MNRARAPRRRTLVSTSAVTRLALIAASAAALSGCTASPGPGPTTEPTASSACSKTDAGTTENPLVVTPASLCGIDGSVWTVSNFTLVVNTPKWDVSTPECDEARKTAYYEGWELAIPGIQTLDLMDSPSKTADMIGTVGVSVVEGPDAAAAIAALDAEGATCGSDTSPQLALEHGAWKGVRGPTSEDGSGERWSWWIAADGRWALVQASASNNATDAQVADVDSAVMTLLDAQEALL